MPACLGGTCTFLGIVKPNFPSAALAACILGLSLGQLGSHVMAAEQMIDGRRFSFPDDYTLELAAQPPLVDRPIEGSFDDKGRLYVTESSGSNEPVAEQLKKKPHRVLRLEDTNGDGIFDRRTVFVDKLMFPEGVLWHEGAVFVAACPEIWKFTDGNDDGVADSREVWFDGKTLTGCANDLHGPYRGPDGWIYWCKGAFAEQTYELTRASGANKGEKTKSSKAWKTRASHVFRARPDASGIEPVFTAGMDNPVGLAWTPEGELIVSGTFFQHPAGGRRDGLIHAIRGGVWGKDHDVIEGHPRTGGLMPPMTHMGPAAPCGLIRYGRDLLCCQFNMRKVSRHRLVPEGSTYRTEDSDFLLCDHPDFHPTAVLQVADGSVLVIDTGGWYKLCCPTSQLAKPDVLGAIYRLRKKGGEMPVAPPKAQWEIVNADNPAELREHLKSPNLALRRAAAEALGQWPAKQPADTSTLGALEAASRAIVSPLLEAAAAQDADRFLEHAITYALIEGGDPRSVREGLSSAHPRVQQIALYAINEIDIECVDRMAVIDLLSAPDERVRSAALYVVGRHPEWSFEVIPWLRRQLASPGAGGETLKRVLLALIKDERTQRLIGDEIRGAAKAAARATLLDVMAHYRAKKFPPAWIDPLKLALAKEEPGELAQALRVLSAAPPEAAEVFPQQLDTIARSEKQPLAIRLRAVALMRPARLDDSLFAVVARPFQDASVPADRAAAIEVLAHSKAPPEKLWQVASWLPSASLLERPAMLKAFKGCGDEAVGQKVAEALDQSSGLKNLSDELVKECLGAFSENVQQRLMKARTAGPQEIAQQQTRLAELEAALDAGDANRGSLVFQSAKAVCNTCHQIGYKGGLIGPDLTKIGAVRTKRDLLEGVIFPSASFVRSYEPVQITKNDGQSIYGIVRGQSPDEVTLATAPNIPEQSVPLSEINQMTPGELSLMPGGYDQLLTPQELSDLVAFLASLK
ncbi:MAG: PVC-type heme-binding CxxCH protein [Verrucomicrobiales bacterium]